MQQLFWTLSAPASVLLLVLEGTIHRDTCVGRGQSLCLSQAWKNFVCAPFYESTSKTNIKTGINEHHPMN
jgi:hypothetical protein